MAAMSTSFPINRNVGCMALLACFLVPVALSQTPEEFLHSLVGQKLILRHVADKKETKVKKIDLASMNGMCDRAVQIREAAWRRGTARFKLEEIGTPGVAGSGNSCKGSYDEGTLEISKFEGNEPADSLAASVSELLQTPEQYLAAKGVKFDLPPAPDDAPLSKSPPALIGPKLLLTVDPTFSDEARKSKYQGTVVLSVIIGTDGRVHNPKIARSIGRGLDENALRVITMWRFEPARQLDKAVATRSSIEVSYQLY